MNQPPAIATSTVTTLPTRRSYPACEMNGTTLGPTAMAIWHYLDLYTTARRWAPTYREIGEFVGLNTTSTVAHHLDRLKQAGVLDWEPNRSRAIGLLVPWSARPSSASSPSPHRSGTGG